VESKPVGGDGGEGEMGEMGRWGRKFFLTFLIFLTASPAEWASTSFQENVFSLAHLSLPFPMQFSYYCTDTWRER
jgi:hypothetical protein